MNRLWNDLIASVRREKAPLLIVLLATFLAKGGALLPGFSIDDYASAGGTSALLVDVLQKGRFGHWLLLRTGMALDVQFIPARILFVSFSILGYSILGLGVVRFWRVSGNGWLPLAAAILIANHPYTVEIFTFRIGVAPAAVVMVLIALILFLIARGSGWLPLGSLVFAAALSFYPIALHFAPMIAIVGLVLELARSVLALPESEGATAAAPELSRARIEPSRGLRLLAVVGGGVVLYVVFVTAMRSVLGLSGEYFGFLRASELPRRLTSSLVFAVATFVKTNALIPPTTQGLFGAALSLSVLGLGWQVFVDARRRRNALTLLLMFVLLGAALLWSIGMSLVLRVNWPVPRNMAHVGILWAGVVVLAAVSARTPFIRRAVAFIAGAIVLSFIGSGEHILDDQLRLNRLDQSLASRIVARLEAQPGFASVRQIYVGGRGWSPYDQGPVPTFWGDMNISAFGATWSQAELLREVSGYNLRLLSAPDERAKAEATCHSMAPWPAPESVKVIGDLAIICLTP